MRCLLAAMLLLSTALPALADEVWTTPAGDIVYVEDIGEVAHLAFTAVNGNESQVLEIYVEGLGGNTDHRGTHDGMFYVQGRNDCGAEKTTPSGWSTGTWGKIRIVFDQPGYPSGFDIYGGSCDEELDANPLRAEPK
jgi:hypothetical protein